MIHRPWPFTTRLAMTMADSSIMESGFSMKRDLRTEGLHASDLLKQMFPVKDPLPEEKLRLFGLLGLAFEDRAELALHVLAQQDDWPWDCVRPGEVEHDGVLCSPDILLIPKPGTDVDEQELSLKATWKSVRGWPIHEEGEDGFPDNAEYYLGQCKAYATPLRTTRSILFVYFVCGNYKPPFPQVHGWELEFSEQEVAEQWDSMMQYRP